MWRAAPSPRPTQPWYGSPGVFFVISLSYPPHCPPLFQTPAELHAYDTLYYGVGLRYLTAAACSPLADDQANVDTPHPLQAPAGGARVDLSSTGRRNAFATIFDPANRTPPPPQNRAALVALARVVALGHVAVTTPLADNYVAAFCNPRLLLDTREPPFSSIIGPDLAAISTTLRAKAVAAELPPPQAAAPGVAVAGAPGLAVDLTPGMCVCVCLYRTDTVALYLTCMF